MRYELFKQYRLIALSSVIPIINGKQEYESTRITNIQSTVVIINKGCLLNLKSIVLSLSGMAKYDPQMFAAVIIRAHFGVHVTTCMVFDSGKLVVIGALSIDHSRYSAQMYRKVLSNVKCLYYDPLTQKNVFTNIENLSSFSDFGIHNIVATTKLKYEINQKSFRDTKQRDTNYEPESFPGCPYLVWIKPRENCQCEKKGTAKYSCNCNVQTSLFGSGKVNLTGSKSIRDTNMAKHIIMRITKDFSQKDKTIPKEERYHHRRQAIFKVSSENTGYQPIKKKHKVKQVKLASIIKQLPKQIVNEKFKNVENLFLRGCMLEHIDMVRYLKDISNNDVDTIKNAIMYMELHMKEEIKTDEFMEQLWKTLQTLS